MSYGGDLLSEYLYRQFRLIACCILVGWFKDFAAMEIECIFRYRDVTSEVAKFLTINDAIAIADAIDLISSRSEEFCVICGSIRGMLNKAADQRLMIRNFPEQTVRWQLFTFLRDEFMLCFKFDLFEDCYIVASPSGHREAVATFKNASAAIAGMHLDQIEYMGIELSIDRPDDYMPPEDGDPAKWVEFDGEGNIMLELNA